MEDIILDFSRLDYSDAAPYGEEGLIHHSKMKQIMGIWNHLYQIAEKEGDSRNFQRCHNTISVFASRGAGKTTFLLSFLDKIKKDKNVLCINPIDPSLIEVKQHPFINILASIQEKVEEAKNESRYSVRDGRFEKWKDHEDCYHKLLKALPFIDGIGKSNVYDEWEDEEFISIQGMKKAKAYNNMEKTFHEYIRNTLRLLDKKCLVIPFDDIDTDFKKGFEILELLRKYVSTGQIVTVLTGDLELYSKLVRKNIWQGFDDDFLNKEIEYAAHEQEEFAEMINNLENQYLIKLLKPEYRIHLKTLKEYIDEDNLEIRVTFCNDTNTKKNIKSCYCELLEQVGISSMNKELQTVLCNFLQSLSMRGQIRILTLLNQFHDPKEIGGEKIDLTTGLMNIFVNDINQKAQNTKMLVNGTQVYTIEMLKFLMYSNTLYIGNDFLPTTVDDIQNKALFAVGIKFNQLLKRSPYLIFDYWIRLSYISVLSEKLGGKLTNSEILDELVCFSQMTSNKDFLTSVGFAQAFCNGNLNVYNDNERPDVVTTLAGTLRIDNFNPANQFRSNRMLSMLPIVGTMDTNGNEFIFISIYKLLAIIREVLFCDKTERSLETLLRKGAAYSYFIQPFYLGPKNKKDNEDTWDDVMIHLSEEGQWHDFISDLYIWVSNKCNNISTPFLSRIFTRLYNTMVHIDGENIYIGAGMKFSAYIIALLNAVLVEEMMEYDIPDIDFNISGNIEEIYLYNRQINYAKEEKYKPRKENFYNNKYDSLHNWLVECPLLRVFINPFILSLIENENMDKRQYLGELLKYNLNLDRKASLVKKLNELKNKKQVLDHISEWIKNYKQLKLLEAELDDENIIKGSFPLNNTAQRKIDKIKSLREKTRDIINISSKDIRLYNGMDEMKLDFAEEDIIEELSGIRLTIKNIYIEQHRLDEKINSVSGFVKEDYEKLKKKSSTVFDILNSYKI